MQQKDDKRKLYQNWNPNYPWTEMEKSNIIIERKKKDAGKELNSHSIIKFDSMIGIVVVLNTVNATVTGSWLVSWKNLFVSIGVKVDV